MATDDHVFLNSINQKCILLQRLFGYDIEYLDETGTPVSSWVKQKFPDDLAGFKPLVHATILEQLNNSSPDKFFHYTCPFRMAYLAVSVWCESVYKGVVIVGPFLQTAPNNPFIQEIIDQHKIPVTRRVHLQEFYGSLTVTDYHYPKNLGSLMVNLFSNRFIDSHQVTSDHAATVSENYDVEKSKETDALIEFRYNIEKKLLHAIEKGDKEEALKVYSNFQFDAAHRVPNNPLRAFKNLGYTTNTLFRISVERGGVHPIYIHNISDKFAILIEKATTVSELQDLTLVMLVEYCDAVNAYVSHGYSPIVQRAINYINFNFDTQIKLNSISKSIFANPSYLSKKFKQETGMTITEYVNQRRIKEAKFLIEETDTSITDIAHKVGFSNHNYFSTVFKKVTSLTPSEYQSKHKRAKHCEQ